MTKIKRIIFVPQLIAIIMLAWALVPTNPYGYYMLLRFVICGICCYLAFVAYEIEESKNNNSSAYAWVWVLGISAIIYNPIFRVHLNRELWSVINVATIVLMIITIVVLKQSESAEPDSESKEDAK